MTTTDISTAPFTAVCTATERADGRYDGVIDPTWTIGRKLHGGAIQAACAAAARTKLRADGPDEARAMQPIAVSTDYLGAPDPGKVIYDVTVRKTGRQICLADVELIQEGRTFVRAAVTLGQLDETPPTWQAATDLPMPVEPHDEVARYDDGSPLSKIVNLARGCELRLDRTSAPFLTGGTGEPSLRLWARPFPDDEADPDVAVLFAMMTGDISPPVLINRGMFGWAPTVQMTTYLQRRPAPGWLRVVSSTKSVGTGLFDEDHVVVDSTGALVVQSRQLAMIPRG